MFILTNINAAQDLVQVFDTDDGTNDVMRLTVVAQNVVARNLKIYGLGRLGRTTRQSAIPLPQLGIYCDIIEAKEAFATYYQKHGMSRRDARIRAGLTPG